MLEHKTAVELIISTVDKLPSEPVELQHALHRVLAEDVFYDSDMPPFNKSAMDGFACREADLQNVLEVVETIHAGKLPEKEISKNQCFKIMTGAVVPAGADFVFKKEDAAIMDSGKVRWIGTDRVNHICYKGEDIKTGDKVLGKSTFITSRHLPLLAGAGIFRPLVYRQPQLAVFATGTELVEPHVKPLSFQIRNTNSSQVIGQLAEMNIPAYYGGILPDEQNALMHELARAFETHQVIVLTGGVSVGDFDLVPGILAKLGFNTLIHSIAIKPGKPMVFARKNNLYCFGLSGNPVSSFVQFELFVKPFLFALSGYEFEPVVYKLPLGRELVRGNAGRTVFLPANLTGDMEVVPVDFHGSAHIHALGGVSCLMEIEKGIEKIEKGALVNVRPL